MMNAQPPPLLLLGAGLPLPLPTCGLPGRLPDGGAAADDPPEPAVTAGLVGGGGWDAAGAALVSVGAGTDETCDTCETWDTCPPVPDTCDE
jgi:hypothetical protein